MDDFLLFASNKVGKLNEEDVFVSGPLVTSLFLIYQQKISENLMQKDFVRIRYQKELKSRDTSKSMFSFRKVDKKDITFTLKVDNTDENYISLYLKDWHVSLEQIAINFKQKRIIYTDNFLLWTDKKVLSFGDIFHYDKIIKLFSWNYFLESNGVDFKFNKEKILKNLFLLTKPAMRPSEKNISLKDSFDKEYFDKNILLPYIYLFKQKNIQKKLDELDLDINDLENLIQNIDVLIQNNNIRIDNNEYSKEFVLKTNRGVSNDSLLMLVDKMEEDAEYIFSERYPKEDCYKYMVADLLNNSSITYRENLLKALQLDIYSLTSIMSNKKFNRQISNKKFLKIKNKLADIKKSGHVNFFNKIQEMSEKFDFHNLLDFLEGFTSNEGKSFVGFFENYNIDDISFTLSPKDIFKKIESDFFEMKEKNQKQLVSPINIEEFRWKNYVKELVSDMDLEMEGENLNHCVGGYTNQVKLGYSRIFNISYKSRPQSTLELSLDKKNNIFIKQHKSYNNTNPHYCNHLIADRLCKYINDNDSVKKEFKESEGNRYDIFRDMIELNEDLLDIINNRGDDWYEERRRAPNRREQRRGRGRGGFLSDLFDIFNDR